MSIWPANDLRITRTHNPALPLVTVITVVYNAEKFIEQTIKSIIQQTYQNIEYIIIDGHSTDNTLSIIKLYESNIDCLISENDNGIYDAMNKGLNLSSGEFILFLNASDTLFQDSIEKSIRTLMHTKKDFSYGSVFVSKNGRIINTIKLPSESDCLSIANTGMPFPHVASLARKSIFQAIGHFNTSFKLIADQDWYLRALKAGFSGVKIEGAPLGIIETGGASDSYSALRERLQLALRENPTAANAIFGRHFIITIKFLVKKLLNSFLSCKIPQNRK